jgi:hypothetical protein
LKNCSRPFKPAPDLAQMPVKSPGIPNRQRLPSGW